MRTLRWFSAVLLGAAITSAAAASSSVVTKIGVAPGVSPCAAIAGGRFVWVSGYGSPVLLKIDPRRNRIVGTTKIGLGSCGGGAGAGSVWIEDTNSSTVSRVSIVTGRRTAAIKVDATPYDTTFAFGAAWATAYGDGKLDRIDPARNRVVKRIELIAATGVIGAFDSIWATGATGLIRVDPTTNETVARIDLPFAGWLAASDDAVWVATGTSIVRVDPETNSMVATIPIDGPLGDPDVIDGLVWVPQIRKNRIALVDPARNAVARYVKAGQGPFVVTQIAGEAWVPSWKGRDIWRYRP